MMNYKTLTGSTIALSEDDSTWEVLAVGAMEEGRAFFHIASKTEGFHQRNGWSPKQRCCWLKDEEWY